MSKTCRSNGSRRSTRGYYQPDNTIVIIATETRRLLKYCRMHKGKVHSVVVFNLTRFARENYDHLALGRI